MSRTSRAMILAATLQRIIFLVLLLLALLPVVGTSPTLTYAASGICALPGVDGPATSLTGVVNTYYPGTASVAAAATTITLGAHNTGDAGRSIQSGDLLLVIQMQDAAINNTNDERYGDGSGTAGNTTGNGSGASALNNTGLYEYVIATNTVATTGGSLTLKGAGTGNGLVNAYNAAAATATQGQRTFQVVHVPQYSSATLTAGLTAARWNGSTGGVLAFDVAGSISLNGATISVDGLGFRGGGGRALSGTAGGSSLDYRNLASNNYHGAKGEGIAGTPRYTFNAATNTVINNTIEGYPNGSTGRGAPGNAAGGGTDSNPNSNDQNSGGGGGGNGGVGGMGGKAWSSTSAVGGFGGALFSNTVTRAILGGGGGAGSTNDGTGTPTAGVASSGAPGGGMVLVRAGSLSGTGTISANGTNANNTVLNDGSGGGGAGGSVIVVASSGGMAGLTVNAKGGTGGTNTGGGAPHGPGAGGGGGFVALSSAAAGINVVGGVHGTTAGTPSDFGSTDGSAGSSTTAVTIGQTPGVDAGASCVPSLTVTKTISTATVLNGPSGTTATYTILVANAAGRSSASNVSVSDTLPTGFTYASGAAATLSGGATGSATPTNSGSSTAPSFGTYVIPGGGSVSIQFSVAVASSVLNGTYQNGATATYLDPARTTTTGTTTASYNSAASTGEDVTVTAPNLVVAKSHTGNFTVGQNNTYTLAVTNQGTAATSGSITVVDILPTGLTYSSATGTGWSCSAAGQTVTCIYTGANLATSGAASTTSVALTVAVGAGAAPGVTNNASVSGGGESTGNNTDNTTTDPTTVNTSADVVVTKTGPTTVNANGNIAYTITIQNNGPSVATNVVVKDTLPAGVTFVSATGSGSLAAGVVTFPNIASLSVGAGSAQTYGIVVTAPANGATLTNTAFSTATTNDPTPANNNGTAPASQVVTTVVAQADLQVTKIVNNATPNEGTNVIYTVTITNNGPSTATGISLRDTLPAGLTYVSNTASGGTTYTSATGIWTIGTLASGASRTLTITASVNTGTAGTIITNATSNLTATEADPTAGNNVGSVAITVNPALVSGHVFLDTNGNGTQDTGEPNLSGATVTITPSSGAPFTVTTNGSGDYTATVPSGSTQLNVTDPTGTALTTANDPQTVTAVSGQTIASTAVGFQGRGSVTGHVFTDSNANGTQDTGEPNLNGVVVTVTNAFGGTHTGTTDANGNYTISNVPAGNASANVSDPSGTVLTTANDPQNVTVIAGASVATTPVGFQGRGAITGHVFSDTNGNATQDTGEPDTSGINVVVTDAFGTNRTATTDATGNYTVSNIPAGNASVTVTIPAGTALTTANNPQTVSVTSGATSTATTVGFQGRGSITGHVFTDTNGNATQDTGEPNLNGVTVTVTDAFGGTHTATTDANGNYAVSNVPAGSASANVTDPTGTALTTANDPQTVTVIAGASAATTAVGFQPRGSVTGHVFSDTNGNGTQDTGEPDFNAVTVTITDAYGALHTTTTGANGNYVVTNIPAGAASANVTDPNGSILTTTNNPQSITVTAGTSTPTTAVGYQPVGVVTGRIFVDTNGNGTQDTGELGLNAIQVTITSQGNTQTVTTDSSGNYSASNVPAGTVTVDVVDATLPANAVQTAGTDPSTVLLTAGTTADAGIDGYQLPGSISGRIFGDTNGNGTQDGGESGLSGVQVTITDSQGGTHTATTDANGNYSASSIPAGTATVDVDNATLPPGSIQTAGTDPSSVVVPSNGSITVASDGYQALGTVTGIVFADLNGNGTQDTGELGLSGVTITVTDAYGGAHTATTDTNGNYSASGVPAGTATVDIDNATLPIGSVQTAGTDPSTVSVSGAASSNAGSDGYQQQADLSLTKTASQANPNVGDTIDFTLTVNNAGPANATGVQVTDLLPAGLNFVSATPAAAYNSATGIWTVGTVAGGSSSSLTIRAQISAAGTIANTAEVTASDLADPNSTPGNGAALPAEDDRATVTLNGITGTVSGLVFADINGNGTQDTGELGLANVQVEIADGSGAQIVVTAADGTYSAVVQPGTVTVDVVNTTLPAGSVATAGTDPTTLTVPGGITVDAGIDGYQQLGNVTGRVFKDSDGNATINGAESGLSGIAVTITDAYGGTRTVTTNANGDYTVTGIPAGNVTIDVADPAGLFLTTANDPQSVIMSGGATNTATDVGFQERGAITGHVFTDTNGNGTQETGEPNISGVAVTATDAYGGTHTATTDANGDYSIAGIPAGSTTVDVTDPADTILTTANDPQIVSVTGGTISTAAPVGFQPQGAVIGHVFIDTNGNATQDTGEPDATNVTVTVADAYGSTLTTTTDANGNYTVAGVPAGSATITVSDPAGTVLTTANNPQTVTVTSGVTSTAANVGFQPQGTVVGHVFSDTNGNGTQDIGEPNLSGVTVTVTDAFGGTHTATTDANGDYSITGVPEGTASVDVSDPIGTALTTINDPQPVSVTGGATSSASDVGFQGRGTITGHVFSDTNGNGTQDTGEPNLNGLLVTVTDAYGGSHTTITHANGDYSVAGIPAGNASVDVATPANTVLTTANDPQTINIGDGTSVATSAVGFQPQGTVTGHVFSDTNGNSTQDTGEPDLSGVIVTVADSYGGTYTVTTDANGDYSVTGVPEGTASIDVTDPAGTVLTTANDPQTVSVASGTTTTAADVGFQGRGTITGHVFSDTNGNGTQDTGEPDLGGVSVTVTDAFGATKTTTTDTNGDYSIADVPAGNVSVDVSDPAGTVLTTANDPQTVSVTGGATSTAAPVGFQPQGTVTGHVFTDTDGNGTQGTGEPDLSGVTVTITDALGGTHTGTTDATGNYSVASIPAGNASINVTDPVGTVLTTANDPQTVSVAGGTISAASDSGFQGRGTVSGHVFTDTNGNGIQNVGEPNLGGIAVTIVDAYGGTHTAMTDANGNYSASGIPAGSAQVDVTDPAGMALTTANDPQTVTVATGATTIATDVGFQERGTITGHVFIDTNGNGTQDTGEPDLSAATITVTDAFGDTYTSTTNTNGNYSVANVPAGNATIDVVDPAGTILTTANDPQTLSVLGGAATTAAPVGFQPQGSITGHVFSDTNGNGTQDTGEPNLGAVQVTITDSYGGSRVVATDANGDYSVAGIPAGSTIVDVSGPANTALTTGNDPQTVSVTGGAASTAVPVGFQPQGTITGHVFTDTNGNGTQDGVEPNLSGVIVTVADAFGGTYTASTDASGNYSVANVPEGNASIDVSDPAGTVLTTANDPQTVSVTGGATSTATAVGFQPQGSVTGHIFSDTNGNGTQDVGEPDASGATVTLTDVYGTTHTATTDATGNYTLTSIPEGNATIDVSVPAGTALTTANDPQTVSVTSGTISTATAVGFQPQGTVTGHVFSDTNGNGTQDVGEPNAGGVNVTVTDAFGGTHIATTDVNGDYNVAGIPVGTAIIDVSEPTSTVLTTANDPQTVNVISGTTTTAATVGFQPQGTVTGHVFSDTNGNGTQDVGEPNAGGVSVTLTDAFGVTYTGTTDATGNYSITGVSEGTASIDVSDPAGTVLTTANDPQPLVVVGGATATATPVGFQPQGTITGHVFTDTNGNGTQDTGEPDLNGVTVTVTDAFGVSKTATTDANGDYNVIGVPAGTASVNISDPADTVLTTANDPQPLTVVGTTISTATPVGFQPQGTITGHVFSDTNGNGTQDVGEPDASGVTVTAADAFGVSKTATTDATGNYTISGVPEGTTSVDVSDPAGTALTTANDPQTVSVTSGAITTVTAVGFQPQGTITGHVFTDTNGNGTQDTGEPDLNGLTVTVTDAFGGTHTATTDATGNYSATGIPAGSVSVAAATPAGVVLTTANNPQTITVARGATSATTAVGFQSQSAVTGHVFSDTNGNGTQDVGEPDANGVTVTVTDAFGSTHPGTTDATGNYSITGVPAGTASVDVSDPAGTVLTTANDPQGVSVTAGAASTAAPVGFQPQGTITGHVFSDTNGNGTQDGGEPDASGVTVTVTDAFGGTHSATTDATGNYSIIGVPAGTATVDVSDPADTALTTGNDPQIVSVTGGATANATAVGFQPQGTVTGHVFNDTNGNGTQDTGEPDLSGLTVTLTDAFGGIHTATTDATGSYSATGIPAGTVSITAATPAGAVLTTANNPQTIPVASGASSATTAVGFQSQGTITGHVFTDTNGNSTQDTGEPDANGVTVTIVDAYSGTFTTITDVNGDYSVTGIPSGTASVTIDTPTGSVLTTTNNPQTVTIPATGSVNTTPVGYQPQGTVTGHVFTDANGNGTQDVGEPDASGATVTLTDVYGGTHTVTTDANGNYSATGIPAGSTTVTVTDPAGTVLTTTNNPQTVIVAGGGSAATTPVGFQSQGTVTGHVFSDTNGNGTQDGGELDASGVTVTVTDAFGATHTGTTDATGNYSISGLPAGTTSVDVSDPAGTALTTANDPQGVSVTAGAASTAAPVGFQPQGAITGHVFSDTNGNGTQDGGELDASGVTVTVTDAFGATYTGTTDANGNYSISGVPTGTATVDVSAPAGSALTTGNDPQLVTVASGGSTATTPVGFQSRGALNGHVFSDINGNGTQDAGELGLGGVSITISDAYGATQTITTDVNGDYSATNIPAGSVTIDVVDSTLPPGSVLTAGTDPTTIAVTAGTITNAGIQGYQQRGNVSGHLFNDIDGDGTQDAGEPTLSGVLVTVTDATGTSKTVTTDASGNYIVVVIPGAVTVDINNSDPNIPAGATVSTGAGGGTDPQTVTAVANTTTATQPVGFYKGTTATGHLFNDYNNNGIQDAGEPGLSGVRVVVTDNTGVPQTVVTDAQGNYLAVVQPGVITVDVNNTDLPAGAAVSTSASGGVDPQTITAIANVATATSPVGYYAPGTLNGRVFSDNNGNGIQDAGELGLAAVQVTITDSLGVVHTLTTDGSGNYSIVLPIGPTTINVVDATLPAGSALTTNNDPQTVSVVSSGIAASANGYQQRGSIAGHLFNDVNGNGVQDAGEGNLANVQLSITDRLGNNQIITTNAAGDYTAVVPVGTATVDVVEASLPAGSAQTAGSDPTLVTIAAGGSTNAGVDGYQQRGTIAGHLFNDIDRDGIEDPGEQALAGIQLTIMDSQGNTYTVTTDANGNYSLSVPVGNTTLTIVTATLPNGAVLTTGNASQTVVVVAGVTATSAPIGYTLRPTAIALVSFTATIESQGIVVRWQTSAEINTYGFALYRSIDGKRSSAVRVTTNPILGQGRGQGGASYIWIDQNTQPGETYTYWLQEIEIGGATNEYGPATAQQSVVDTQKTFVFLPIIRL